MNGLLTIIHTKINIIRNMEGKKYYKKQQKKSVMTLKLNFYIIIFMYTSTTQCIKDAMGHLL